jgi:hypothetical protein
MGDTFFLGGGGTAASCNAELFSRAHTHGAATFSTKRRSPGTPCSAACTPLRHAGDAGPLAVREREQIVAAPQVAAALHVHKAPPHRLHVLRDEAAKVAPPCGRHQAAFTPSHPHPRWQCRNSKHDPRHEAMPLVPLLVPKCCGRDSSTRSLWLHCRRPEITKSISDKNGDGAPRVPDGPKTPH